MLKERIITGALLCIAVATVLVFSYIPPVLNIAIAFVAMQAARELFGAVGIKSRWTRLVSCFVIALVSFADFEEYTAFAATAFAVGLIVFSYLMHSVGHRQGIKPVTGYIIAAFILLSLKTMSAIRAMKQGVFILAAAIVIPVLTDIAAFLVGKSFGNHKLAPALSPKKTVEGSVAGTVCATAIILLFAQLLQALGVVFVRPHIFALYVLMSSLLAQLGDLAFSSVKRISGIKDFGKLLPGHGGILDRFDSLLPVLPFTYLFFRLF